MDFLACCLRNFKVSDYAGPIEIKSNGNTIFYLLFQEREILNIPMSYNYSIRFGLEEVERVTSHFVTYSHYEPSILDIDKRKTLVNNRYLDCQTFSNALWFIKDNSVTPYFATISSNSEIEPESLRRNVYFSDSETRYTNNFFSLIEIIDAMKWFEIIDKFNIRVERAKMNLTNNLTNMSAYLQFNIPSFQRAYYFLNVTRKTDFLPSKIASYISILETFYAVEGDNKHKTSERTAFLLGKDGDERISIYDHISEAYVIRSKYVHGAYISDERNKKLAEVSKNLDKYVRMIFKEMLINHPDLNYNSGKNQKVDKKFNELILNKA